MFELSKDRYIGTLAYSIQFSAIMLNQRQIFWGSLKQLSWRFTKT